MLPYLTSESPGIGGRIKETLEDFRVEELPLYDICGQGTHLYFRVTKAGIPTPVAVQRLARFLGVHPAEVGFAGLKDAQAITTQLMSVEFAQSGRLERFRDAQMKVEPLGYHRNKLRPGLLAGNRFYVRIRGVGEAQAPAAQAILDVLARRGVPNYFGHQRFGSRGDTGALGAAIVRNDLKEFVAIFLGRAMPTDPPDCKAARDAFDAGYYGRAMQRWPRHFTDQRRALVAYKRKQNPLAAMSAVDKRLRRLFVSAFQSEIFNAVLARRIDRLDEVMAGDLAQKSDTGGIFPVEDLAADLPRAARFEISATGPIVGFQGDLAGGEPGRIEQEVLARHGVHFEDFRRAGAVKSRGSRRALRFAMVEPRLAPGRDMKGEFLELSFTAPSGCYATVVLRELMKTDAEPAADEPAEAPAGEE
jgi:tRNA pseudouridine13 synthase